MNVSAKKNRKLVDEILFGAVRKCENLVDLETC